MSQSNGPAKQVLSATALMAADPALQQSAFLGIDGGATAEAAVWQAGAELADQLMALGGYMAERAADVLDVRNRIVCALYGVEPPVIPVLDEPFVLIADDLAPADTATLDPASVRAIVTARGGAQSHTAILARSLGIAAVVGLPAARELPDGCDIFVDGISGEVAHAAAEHHAAAAAWQQTLLSHGKFDGTTSLACGTPVTLCANVGGAADARTAREHGARGVGLFRTEFCFLGSSREPSVAEQAAEYRAVLQNFTAGAVVIRTLDAGSDKPLAFLPTDAEPNPALGIRGIRTTRNHPDILTRQLEAIASAAHGLDVAVSVMVPMVSTVQEAEQIAALCALHGIARCGVMIETPSAALMAGEILDVVDFVSIGTNDLTQYTMAADREHGGLTELQDPWQPAVLRLIRTVTDAARRTRPSESDLVGVCGESAADPALATVLVGLGVQRLSMAPRALAAVSHLLGLVTRNRAELVASAALAATSATAARSAVREALPELADLGY